MDDLLQRLEKQIQLLMQRCEHLTQRELQLQQEKEALLAKHNKAILQIENMVSSLKSLEAVV